MNVKLLVFQIQVPTQVGFRAFAEHLQLEAGDGIDWAGMTRQVHLDDLGGGYWGGVVVTVRKHQRVLALQNGRITATDLRGGMMECNFFVVRADTGRGLYTHYVQSMGLTLFQRLLREHYKPFKDARIEEELTDWAQAEGRPVSSAARARIRRQYKGLPQIARMVDPKMLSKQLGELEELFDFEFYYATLLPQSDPFRPLRKAVRSQKLLLRFKPTIGLPARVKAIVGAVTGGGLNKGTIHGIKDGVRVTVKTDGSPFVVEHWDFDDMMEGLEVDLKDLRQCGVLLDLKARVEGEPMFGIPAR